MPLHQSIRHSAAARDGRLRRTRVLEQWPLSRAKVRPGRARFPAAPLKAATKRPCPSAQALRLPRRSRCRDIARRPALEARVRKPVLPREAVQPCVPAASPTRPQTGVDPLLSGHHCHNVVADGDNPPHSRTRVCIAHGPSLHGESAEAGDASNPASVPLVAFSLRISMTSGRVAASSR